MRRSVREFIESQMQDHGDVAPDVEAEVLHEVRADDETDDVADVVARVRGRRAPVSEVVTRSRRPGGLSRTHR